MRFIGYQLFPILSFYALCSCGGSGTSPDDELSYVASGYNMDLYNLFACSVEISADANEELFESFGYSSADTIAIELVYNVLFGTELDNRERIVSAQVQLNSGTSTVYERTNTLYFDDDEQGLSAISVGADVVEGDDDETADDGLFSFATTEDVPAFVYSDANLDADVSYTFNTENTETQSSDCAGTVVSFPAS